MRSLKNISKLMLLVAMPLFLSGCVFGIIYSDTTNPVTLKMQKTPVGTKVAKLHSNQLQAPIGSADITAVWSSRAIGDAARSKGITKIYYADERVQSVLAGIWERDTIIVHGD